MINNMPQDFNSAAKYIFFAYEILNINSLLNLKLLFGKWFATFLPLAVNVDNAPPKAAQEESADRTGGQNRDLETGPQTATAIELDFVPLAYRPIQICHFNQPVENQTQKNSQNCGSG